MSNMIQYDIKSVNINDKKYALPFNSESHIDVYKIQCSLFTRKHSRNTTEQKRL